MSFVFVTYAAPDRRTQVRPLVQALAIEGVRLWLDRPGQGLNDFDLPPSFVVSHAIEGLRPGQAWDEGLQMALRDAGAVLVCLSKAALDPNRDALRDQIRGAQLLRKSVFCIVDDLDLSMVPPELSMLSLHQVQALRVDSAALGLAVDWLSAHESRTPDELPEACRVAWKDIRRLVSTLQTVAAESRTPLVTPHATSTAGMRAGATGTAAVAAGCVFVSHASNDRIWADALVAALEAEGLPCWLAARDILPAPPPTRAKSFAQLKAAVRW